MNYYDLYEISISPIVDTNLVMKKYRLLQRQMHPDKHIGKSEEDRMHMEAISAEVNKAFEIFKHPMATLEYYLKFRGFLQEGEKYELSKDFLMKMMDMNEMLEEEGKSAYEEAISKFEDNLDAEAGMVLQKGDAITAEEISKILLPYYFKKKYLLRLLDRLKD